METFLEALAAEAPSGVPSHSFFVRSPHRRGSLALEPSTERPGTANLRSGSCYGAMPARTIWQLAKPMNVPWPVARCVLCLRERAADDEQTWLTDAHVIPASVGGRLSAHFLCGGCNSRLGAEVEAPLLSDPSIRVCFEALADRLPDELLSKMRQRQRWFVDTDMGQVEAVGTAGGDLMPRESATFRREENARDEMVTERRRQGMSEEETADHLAAVDAVAGSPETLSLALTPRTPNGQTCANTSDQLYALTLRMSYSLAQLSPSLKGDSGGGG